MYSNYLVAQFLLQVLNLYHEQRIQLTFLIHLFKVSKYHSIEDGAMQATQESNTAFE